LQKVRNIFILIISLFILLSIYGCVDEKFNEGKEIEQSKKIEKDKKAEEDRGIPHFLWWINHSPTKITDEDKEIEEGKKTEGDKETEEAKENKEDKDTKKDKEVEEVTLDIEKEGEGLGLVSGEGTYLKGSEAYAAAASAGDRHEFVGWPGCCPGLRLTKPPGEHRP